VRITLMTKAKKMIRVNVRRRNGDDSEEDTNFNNDVSNQQDATIFFY